MSARTRKLSLSLILLAALFLLYIFILQRVVPIDYAALVDRWREHRPDERQATILNGIEQKNTTEIGNRDRTGSDAGTGKDVGIESNLFVKVIPSLASHINQSNFASAIHDCGSDVIEFMRSRDETDRENQHPLRYLPGLKSPCWFENLNEDDVAQSTLNPYRTHKRVSTKHKLKQLSDLYEQRLKSNVTVRLRCLPTFIIIGQAKCGTTDLFLRLSKHPQVGEGLLKEPNWWTDANGGYGKLLTAAELPFSSYADLYGFPAIRIEQEWAQQCYQHQRNKGHPNQCAQTITGEASVATLSDNNPVDKMKVFGQDFRNRLSSRHQDTKANYVKWILPDAKIIIILRNPSTRLYSDYLFFDKKLSASQQDFHRKVIRSIAVYKRCLQHNDDDFCVYDRSTRKSASVRLHSGIYSTLIAEWLNTFSEQKMLVLRLEDYSSDMRLTLARIYTFLEICQPSLEDEISILGTKWKNQSPQKIGPMWNETRHLLDQFYSDYNRKLANMLDDDRFLWAVT